LKNTTLWAIAAASFVAIFALDVPFPLIVGLAAAVGYVGGRVSPSRFQTGGAHQAADASYGPALIDDHTPPPAHAHFSVKGLAQVLAAGAVLWAVPMGVLCAVFGWQHSFTQMAWFFTKAALLTFGGAYAVLPYVYQGAVREFAWVTPTQMMDGLALGETTPGPLIMVVAFVGFVGGWGLQVLGPQAQFWGAALAATVVTWFTFLPSFVFILAGGPLVESTHGKLQFTAPLIAITAAVVGVIASLALFFIAHIAYKTGANGTFFSNFDFAALILAALAALALLRYKLGVVTVIAGCALTGLVVKMTGLG
jgi:chromate transporter